MRSETPCFRPAGGSEGAGAMGREAETILVVEDEPEVRGAVVEMLQEMGFTVLAAASGLEAVEVSAGYQREIHLLLTDLIMPGMTGRLLFDMLSAQRPDMDVIFMSGYVEDTRQLVMEPPLHYLQKPLDWGKLEKKVNEVFEEKRKKG